jgi:hypothetical protein
MLWTESENGIVLRFHSRVLFGIFSWEKITMHTVEKAQRKSLPNLCDRGLRKHNGRYHIEWCEPAS